MSPSRPRVLLLAPHWPPDAGAAAARLSGLARELRALGHDLRVVAPTASYLVPEGAAGEGAGVHRVSVPARGSGAAGNALHQLRLRAALRAGALAVLATFDAEVVLVSSPPPVAALAGLGLRGAGGRALPLVLDLRDLWPDVLVEAGAIGESGPAAQLLRFVERRLLDGAAAVTTVTETKCERLLRRTRRPVRLVPNGVDASWCEAPPPAPPRREGFEVLYAGNVGRAQDLALLVRAIGRVPGARATVVGDGEERPAAAALAAATQAPVRFLPPESRAMVRERLAACDCAFVSLRTAALVDAVPSKLLEALALGVPVLLAAAGESARLLEASGGGLVVPPGRPAALAEAIAALAALDESARREMGERGRAFVLERFRREDAAARLSQVLVEAAA